MIPLLWEGTLRVGMSVPAHPQAIERLVGYGYRGWLKPPPPEEGFEDVPGAGGMGHEEVHTQRGRNRSQPLKGGMMNPENGRARIVSRFTFRKLSFEGYGLGIEGLRGAEFMQLWGVTGTT